MKTIYVLTLFTLLTALVLAGCRSDARVGALQTESQSVELGDSEMVSVEVEFGAGDLMVTGGAQKLLEAGFTYNVARLKPEVEYMDGTLAVRQPEARGWPDLRNITDFRNEWELHLSNHVPMDLSVSMGAGTSDLQLAGLSLTGLDVTLGAGKSTVDLSGDWARDLDVTMDSGAADMTLILPGEVGVRVEVDSGPTMINAPDLTKDGNSYTNAAYGSSEVTLYITMEAGIGMVNLEVDEHTQAQAALQNLLDQQVKQQNILGMVMAERLADGTVLWATSGYTSPSGNERWSAHTPSFIASVTKTFTAVVVMQLVEAGKLSLDDTVDAWFPEQPNGDRITVRMLLSHTSGLADYQTVFGMDPEKWTREWAPEDLIAEANKAGPVREPGSRMVHYSNTNYFMLGLIIEKITGNSWAHEVESRIIQPLALNDTACARDDNLKEIAVPGYIRTADGYLGSDEFPWYPHASTAWAAGEIVSSASDLLAFASALFDGKLVSGETLAVMTQPVGTGDGHTFALGGVVVEVAGRQAFAMAGDSTTGYHAFFIGIPGSKLAVTALVNTVEGNVISPSLAALEYISQELENK
jgi:D-alanyl-D-alanine carboxypeptidase